MPFSRKMRAPASDIAAAIATPPTSPYMLTWFLGLLTKKGVGGRAVVAIRRPLRLEAAVAVSGCCWTAQPATSIATRRTSRSLVEYITPSSGDVKKVLSAPSAQRSRVQRRGASAKGRHGAGWAALRRSEERRVGKECR